MINGVFYEMLFINVRRTTFERKAAVELSLQSTEHEHSTADSSDQRHNISSRPSQARAGSSREMEKTTLEYNVNLTCGKCEKVNMTFTSHH